MKHNRDDYSKEELGKFETFKNIVKRLRSTDGCPWDKKQTHGSLRQYLLEECYEVIQAIDDNNLDDLCEELGDLWLQIMLHAQIASESGEFEIEDILCKINTKLINRHPHVFGSEKVNDAEQVTANWEELKGKEKTGTDSILSGVPLEMPALAASQSLQRRAASVGFDWEKLDDIIDKLTEEINELRNASDINEQENEFGDILFTLSNIARRMDIELETALRRANKRFVKRFNCIECVCQGKGLDLNKLTLKEIDALWQEAKFNLK
jgi:tetrapyrrole methylase family protein/MazG family protein